MKPLIGITATTIHNKTHPNFPYSYGQMHTYIEAISASGGIPIIVPIAQTTHEVKDIFNHLDGILFAGGNDLSDHLYRDAVSGSDDTGPSRDKHEATMLEMALESDIAVLCICRGMQLLNLVRGGTLYDDIPKDIPTAENHDSYKHAKTIKKLVHTLSINPRSELARILHAHKIQTNSHHHQAVKELGAGLVVNARAADNIIEGIEDMSDGYVMGIQSHPEAIYDDIEPRWKALFESFVVAAAERF